MGLSSQFCPVCGGPFEGFDIYDDSAGVGDEDGCWASVLSDEDTEVSLPLCTLLSLANNYEVG
jgi:hypothetical protein